MTPEILTTFIKTYLPLKHEGQHFLSQILYGLHYGDFDTTRPASIPCLLFQILAETASAKTLHQAVKRLSYHERLSLIGYCFLHYREGSYFILNEMKATFHADQTLMSVLEGLSRKFFNIHLFVEMIETHAPIHQEALELVLQRLQEEAKKEVAGITGLLFPLIQSMCDSSVKVFHYLEELKTEEGPGFEAYAEAEKASQKLKELFQFIHEMPFEKALSFFHLFGLYDHQPSINILGVAEEGSLVTKLELLTQLFDSPPALLAIPRIELSRFYTFIHKICQQFDTFHHHPSRYVEGLNLLTFACPTKNKELARHAWLPSIVNGLNTLAQHLKRSDPHFTLKGIPIYIFDQSPEKIFAENKKFIEKLSEQFEGDIFHISQDEILLLAHKLKLEKLLTTADGDHFGYGGARNCVYFLTPLLRAAYKLGKRKVAEVLNLDQKTLQAFFEQAVLEVTPSPNPIVHMGDDDIEVPETSLFTDLHFAHTHQKVYFMHPAYVRGRATYRGNPQIDLKSLLQQPASLYDFARWKRETTLDSFVGLISKPKFCLNLPFGYEEVHFKSLATFYEPFRHAVTHLGGTRYPTKQIPSDPLDGIDENLQQIVIYTFHVGMVQSLLDPSNAKQRCALPWNSRAFQNLGEALSFVSQEATQKEMQKRFWKNIDSLLTPTQTASFLLGRDLQNLIGQEVDTLMRTCSNQKIGQIYKRFQKDALLFLDFLERIRHNLGKAVSNPLAWYEQCPDLPLAPLIDQTREEIEKEKNLDLKEWPFSYGLYRLLHVVGAGEFNRLVKAIASPH